MFTKTNLQIFFGVALIALGVGFFFAYYDKHAPSPFDVVDAQTASTDFLPIIAPRTEGMVPTPLEQPLPADSEEAAPSGRIPERLLIPSIFLDAPVIPISYKEIESDGQIYQQWLVPSEFASGWQSDSALLGMPGNTVLNGHHNAFGMVFENLAKVRVGDVISVISGGVEFRYVVVNRLLLPERGQKLDVRLANAGWILPTEDERLTLITCWPATSNSHRLIIIALPEAVSQPQVGSEQSGF